MDCELVRRGRRGNGRNEFGVNHRSFAHSPESFAGLGLPFHELQRLSSETYSFEVEPP